MDVGSAHVAGDEKHCPDGDVCAVEFLVLEEAFIEVGEVGVKAVGGFYVELGGVGISVEGYFGAVFDSEVFDDYVLEGEVVVSSGEGVGSVHFEVFV